jgi:N-succinyldiaminopimelate aminotransferase
MARKMKRFYDVDVNPDTEITVTSGATEGLCATLMGIVEAGDEVILLEPSYDSYAPVATMAKAKIRYVSLEGPEFSLPKEKLAAAFGPRTKAILVNNPQNPCCKTYTSGRTLLYRRVVHKARRLCHRG